MVEKLSSCLKLYREGGAIALKEQFEKRYLYPIANAYYRRKLGPGVDVMNEDWDNLIILDACRYDAFQERNTLDGTLSSKISKGSTSTEFIDSNFTGRELHDTVYVTSNPYVTRIGSDVFHAVLTVLDAWDEELQTVLPEEVVGRALEAYSDFPQKRLIVHFMQPHQPYIGEKGELIRQKMEGKANVIGWKGEPQDGVKQLRAPQVEGIDVSVDDVWEAYLENLDIVLSHVSRLLREVGGKTVITSDHGEMIGDSIFPLSQKIYGHPRQMWTRELRKVPWFTMMSGGRRDIVSETTTDFEEIDDRDLETKLRALGYSK